ncbi:SRPBCC family protein [Nocardia brevicatena]|uniref:SRPBCC family protein n=1 Tax=Nocardia brevicatena TaxID=37327 RepID=UPI000684D0B0|nr:SRPBCC family protein [Nocardia brevicatena]
MPDMGRHGDATLALPSDAETVVTRVFAFPPELVFEMWTDPVHVPRWYGMREFIMSDCRIDLRVGGRWRWAQRNFDGDEIAFSGVYREIDRPNRLVFTEEFEALPGSEYVVTITFAPHGDGGTLLTTHMRYRSREHRDGHLQSGMEEGTNAIYAQLDELMAELSGPAAPAT